MQALLLLVLTAVACGDDAAVDGGFDGGLPDAAPDDAPGDADPPPDAGPPPSCAIESVYTTLVPDFGGDEEEDPSGFAAIAPAGPWAFVYRTSMGEGDSRIVGVEAQIVDATGTAAGYRRFDQVSGATDGLGLPSAAAAGDGLFVVWTRNEVDSMGMVTASAVWHSLVAADGSIARTGDVLFPDAAAPHLASAPPGEVWVLRSDVQFTGMLTGIIPRIRQLDADGAPVGPDIDLSSFTRVEATELAVVPTPSRLVLAYWVPPSTAFVVPMTRAGTPDRALRMTGGVPNVDDFAATEDSVAFAWSEVRAGTGSVGIALTDAGGNLRMNVPLASIEAVTAPIRIAVAAAWPGFVAVWREGVGDEAVLRVAGLDTRGTMVVPPAELVATPGVVGDLFLEADGRALTVGSRAREAGSSTLAFARACLPL